MNSLPEYHYGSARTMVNLHGQYMQDLLVVWKQAKAVDLELPETDDASYESLETLLWHVLRAARGYMVWMTEKLELPDPEIDQPPALESVATEADSYLSHLIQQWRMPLAAVEEDQFGDQEYRANWGGLYSIDSMLEHAVMHTILHRVQLVELLEEQQ